MWSRAMWRGLSQGSVTEKAAPTKAGAARAMCGTKANVMFTYFASENFAAPEIERLMDCVTCRVDPTLDAQYPGAWPARVEVILADGRTLAASAQYAKDDPRNPRSQDQVFAKHRSVVDGGVEAMLDFILSIEKKPDISELTRILWGS